jgi:hypothetical protein
MENRITLVDEYDQIHNDLLPFHSLPVREFRRRASSLQTDSRLPWHAHSFGLEIKDGAVGHSAGSAGKGGTRTEDLMDLLGEFSELLPDMEIRFSEGDEPSVVVSGEAKERHIEYAKKGEGAFLSLPALLSSCHPDSVTTTPRSPRPRNLLRSPRTDRFHPLGRPLPTQLDRSTHRPRSSDRHSERNELEKLRVD